MSLLVTNIPWSENAKPHKHIARRLGCRTTDILEAVCLKRSVDARRRPPVWFANYKVTLTIDEAPILQRNPHGTRPFTERDSKRYAKSDFRISDSLQWPAGFRPIIVGAGPAGLFAALRLGEAGAPAILIERGGPVKDRHFAVRDFWRHRKLDPSNNVVYGEGGAGAFSDGKIYTRKRDGELGWIFQRLVDFGADPEILEEGWAHLGTDKIREILPVMRNRIVELGVEVRFHSTVNALLTDSQGCVGVLLETGERITGGPVIMATGHSARDSWRMMLDAGAEAEVRPMRIGARIEHPQRLIDQGRYGQARGDLPPASYRLVSNPPIERGVRGAHTFCMCPGGTVVGASNHEGHVVVNGMSYSKRQAYWANSALIVEVSTDDYDGTDPWAGIRFQNAIEQRAFVAGGSDFRAPAQRVSDFLSRQASIDLPRSSYPQGIVPADLWSIFPKNIAEGLAEAIRFFDRKIPGFAGPDGILIAPETRTTAPLRFLRKPQMESTSVKDLYPIGEGAGYAGGIASAGLEGFRVVQSLIEQHTHLD
ncbi:MAG: NAD(P)/FAD-dependent oxidoreductase [Myxococcota bacterium]